MIRRLPVIPTILVLAAVATMIGLGIWQIGRAQEKDERIATLAERVEMSAATYPYADPYDESFLYRTLEAECSEVIEWQAIGGQDTRGRNGWRQIATCVHAPTDTRFKADMGVSADPGADPQWAGGTIRGRAILEPDERGIGELVTRTTRDAKLMIVAEEAAGDLVPSAQPQPMAAEENSSWAYAGQWFFFALTAMVVYGFAVRPRLAGRK
jgi:cytochrome oxidase assembly protein ShyY1